MARQTRRDVEPIDPDFEPDTDTMARTMTRTVKIAGEALVAPGASLILDGRVVEGGTHVLGALVAKWALGPIGWILVAGNSYCRSVTGWHLHEAVIQKVGALKAAARTGETAPAA